jgi:hypothetical protein
MDGVKMNYKAPSKCPVCGEGLSITKLGCPKCLTAISGEFQSCEFCRLSDEDLQFVKTFIRCRGNIKDVEKELGVSYPTVRGKLDGVIKALGFDAPPKDTTQARKAKEAATSEILNQLSRGELSAKEASERIKNL